MALSTKEATFTTTEATATIEEDPAVRLAQLEEEYATAKVAADETLTLARASYQEEVMVAQTTFDETLEAANLQYKAEIIALKQAYSTDSTIDVNSEVARIEETLQATELAAHEELQLATTQAKESYMALEMETLAPLVTMEEEITALRAEMEALASDQVTVIESDPNLALSTQGTPTEATTVDLLY